MASHDSGPDALAARFELADLIDEAAGGLSDADRAAVELTYRHGLEGVELAAALEVSEAQAGAIAYRVRQTVERPLGALLVARRVRRDPGRCLELATMLNGWDGYFTGRMRERVIGHVDSCLTCELERRRLVTPAALLGTPPVFIPAPDWLRASTLRRVRLTAPGPVGLTLVPPLGSIPVTVGRRGGRRLVSLVLVVLLTATVFTGRVPRFESSRPPASNLASVTSSAEGPESAAPAIAVEPPRPAPDPVRPAPGAAPVAGIRSSGPSPTPVRRPAASAGPSAADIRASRAESGTRPAVTTPPKTATPPPRPNPPGTPGRDRHPTKSPGPAQPPQAADNVS